MYANNVLYTELQAVYTFQTRLILEETFKKHMVPHEPYFPAQVQQTYIQYVSSGNTPIG